MKINDLLGKWVDFKYSVFKDVVLGKKDYYGKYATTTTHEKSLNAGRGILIGERWLPNGNTEWEHETDEFGGNRASYPCFYQDGTTHVFMVVVDARTNPFYVDPATTTLDGKLLMDVLGRHSPKGELK